MFKRSNVSSTIISVALCCALQASARDKFTMEEIEFLHKLEGEWILDEYNEDGFRNDEKGAMYSIAVIANNRMTFVQTPPEREFNVEFIIIEVDLDRSQIKLAYKKVRQWAKVDDDRLIISAPGNADDLEDIPREFEPKRGLTLLTWLRKADQRST